MKNCRDFYSAIFIEFFGIEGHNIPCSRFNSEPAQANRLEGS